MNHLGLFEGIGGFSLAARWMGWKTIAWCEWNPFCQKVLSYHFPKADALHDITKTDFTKYHGTVDIITGGFPCQPYSLAGKQKGTEDERHLWPHMLRAIRQVAPRWVIGENVPGLVSWNDGLVFDQVQLDLEALGYEVIPFNIPAAGVGAPHKRERVWFVAFRGDVAISNVANTNSDRLLGWAAACSRQWQNSEGLLGILEGLSSSSPDENPIEGWDEYDDDDWARKQANDRPTKNTHQDGWGSEQRQEEPEERGQRNTGAGDNEQLRTNHAETGAIANANHQGTGPGLGEIQETDGEISQRNHHAQLSHTDSENATHTGHTGLQGREEQRGIGGSGQNGNQQFARLLPPDWQEFPTQSPVCNGDDGLSALLDPDALSKTLNPELLTDKEIESAKGKPKKVTFANWRAESIKAGGNAIVPQVAMQIFKAIELFEQELKTTAA